MTGKIIVVTGPARSGKSEWAEQLALESARQVIYVATAQHNPHDLEWQARIQQHQARRPPSWQTQHCPTELHLMLDRGDRAQCFLIDSLGTWTANYLEQSDSDWQRLANKLQSALITCPALVIVVAEETGWGVVPAYPLGRLFRDRLGTLTRKIAAQSDATYLVCAGIAVNLKQIGQIVKTQNFER